MIFLKKGVINQIKLVAITSYPGECCGLLIGIEQDNFSRITRIEINKNLMQGVNNNRFEIDPQERIHAERALRGTPEKVIGHFHSHPNNSRLPSKTDIEMAFEPNLVWLIVSIIGGKYQDFGLYRLDQSKKVYTEINYRISN